MNSPETIRQNAEDALRNYQEGMGHHLDHVAREGKRQQIIIQQALVELGAGRQDKARECLKQLVK